MEFITPKGWLRAPGWSHAVLDENNGKSFLKIAGQVGWDMTTQKLVSEDLVEQYNQSLKNICSILDEVGASPENIMDLHIYVTSVAEFNNRGREIGQAYRSNIGKHFPTITLLGVNELFMEDIKIEVDATVVF